MLILDIYFRLDQGLTENYSCPTCRKPLFVGRPENEVNTRAAEVSGDEQLARQMSLVLDRSNLPGHPLPTEVFRNHTQNPLENRDWRFDYFSFYVLYVHCGTITAS